MFIIWTLRKPRSRHRRLHKLAELALVFTNSSQRHKDPGFIWQKTFNIYGKNYLGRQLSSRRINIQSSKLQTKSRPLSRYLESSRDKSSVLETVLFASQTKPDSSVAGQNLLQSLEESRNPFANWFCNLFSRSEAFAKAERGREFETTSPQCQARVPLL